MYSKLLICFSFSFLIVFIQAIDLRPIRVPSIVTEGSSIYLECKFDLEGFNLHAVKWRKNRGLFYKFQPDDPHGIKRSYPIQGVNVNLRFSNETHVFLENVDFNTQGTYSCDVISKDPFQKEVSSEDQLTVVHSDFLFTPLSSAGPPRLQAIRNVPEKHLHVNVNNRGTHADVHLDRQGSVIISPETQKEKTITTTLKKSSTLLSTHDYHHTPALSHGELENVRARLTNTIDLTKLKNLNYNQHHDYVDRNARLHFDEHASKNVKTIDSDYFPVELGPPKVIHTDSPHGHQVTTIKKTILSPKQTNDENILNQKVKLIDHHHPAPINHHHEKSGRYEVEEDGIVFNNNEHHHHPASGGVFSLTPDQYSNFKFLARDPGDVELFKPVSNHSHSSTSFNLQPSWILLNLTLFIILIVNNIVQKH